MHKERDRNARSKFVITETEAWFVRDDDGSPKLFEMLVVAVGPDLSDDAEIEVTDAKLEDGRVLIGYAQGD